MKNFKVAFASNDWYAENLAIAIYSLLKNLSDWYFVEIIILDWWISEKNKKLIKNICLKLNNWNVNFILMDRKKFENLPTTWLSQEIYYRLDLPELLKDDDKILYLDVDIVINDNIWDLFDYDLWDDVVWAVWEITTINYYHDDYNLTSKNRWLFFNSWVLLMNLKKMREINFKEKVYEWFNKYLKKLTFHDQDILNIICENKWISLPPKFNALPFLRTTKSWKYLWYTKEEFYEAKNNPIIIHYASKKPWSNICYHPLKNLYNKYRKECWLAPIKFKKPNIKLLIEKYYSWFWLILLSNLPNRLFRYLVYKPSKRILKKRYK
mgnify:CR=1 FL=1